MARPSFCSPEQTGVGRNTHGVQWRHGTEQYTSPPCWGYAHYEPVKSENSYVMFIRRPCIKTDVYGVVPQHTCTTVCKHTYVQSYTAVT